MKNFFYEEEFERKFHPLGAALSLNDGKTIAGYASVFGEVDRGNDLVEPGAYAKCLSRLAAEGRRIKMLWQHDPAQPIGVWDEVREDPKGLWVEGRLIDGIARGREAIELISAGALDGLSIGYRTISSRKDSKGRRVLTELELWEVSLVTFPMLPGARVGTKGADPEDHLLREMADAIDAARRMLAPD